MNLVIIGAQWGDEGKGKIVDYLADRAENVIRFSGGANAGHTIVAGGRTYKLHLVPSGMVYPGKQCLLGAAMVIDPEALFNELAKLETQGVDWKGRLFVSDRAHLVLPSYKAVDKEQDQKRRFPIGTTGRGIGIAYGQKANRDGLRVCDLYDEKFYSRLTAEEKAFLDPYKEKLAPMVVNAAYWMEERKNSMNLFEGAQGALLDLDSRERRSVAASVLKSSIKFWEFLKRIKPVSATDRFRRNLKRSATAIWRPSFANWGMSTASQPAALAAAAISISRRCVTPALSTGSPDWF